MNQLEENVAKSFRLVKDDMIRLQDKIFELSLAQKKMMDVLEKVEKKNSIKKVNKKSQSRKKTKVKTTKRKK